MHRGRSTHDTPPRCRARTPGHPSVLDPVACRPGIRCTGSVRSATAPVRAPASMPLSRCAGAETAHGVGSPWIPLRAPLLMGIILRFSSVAGGTGIPPDGLLFPQRERNIPAAGHILPVCISVGQCRVHGVHRCTPGRPLCRGAILSMSFLMSITFQSVSTTII